MPGGRSRDYRLGDTAELLTEFILSNIAFTTRVPRQEDIGYDFFCVLAELDGELLRAGSFFTVQTTRSRKKFVYEKDHEVRWIKNQENPFFICIANPDTLSVEIYSTWNMQTGFLAKEEAQKIILAPGGPDDNYEEVQTREDLSEQIIPLGKPILRITAQDVVDEDKAQNFRAILQEWVLMDRENIINRYAGMHWVIAPYTWETNQLLSTSPEMFTAFFWNTNYLSKYRLNFGRAAATLRLTIRGAYGQDGERASEITPEIDALNHALKAHSNYLEPLAKQGLNGIIDFDS